MPKRYNRKDPHYKREAKSYKHPVPSREFITQFLNDAKCPCDFVDLLQAFDLSKPQEKEGLRRRLRAMERDGQLLTNRRGYYALVDKLDLISGRVEGHRDGFGFVITDEPGSDIFMPAREMRKVFPNDIVLVRVTGVNDRNRREGRIVEVLERNTQQIAGRFYKEGGICYVNPDNKSMAQDIVIPTKDAHKAKNGDFVVVEITAQPDARRQATGKVVKVLGNQLTPGMEMELAVRSYDLPWEWPKALEQQATKIAKKISDADTNGRKDLRDLPFITIDGDDSKDFDDAVYCEKRESGGWRLYVAVADVAHYVKPKTALDKEAELRGNSVYFSAEVIPMLPEVLSNEMCSLKPKVDRLAMVCDMTLNDKGKVLRYRFYEAVIHSHARTTYTQVAEVLDKKQSIDDKTVLKNIRTLLSLYNRLHKNRQLRGAIEFDSQDTKVVFGDNGKIEKIVLRERNVAHRIIEECMLFANVITAKYLEKNKIPTLYRVHESPDEQKLIALHEFLGALGLKLHGALEPTAKEYCNLLKKIENRKDKHLIQTVLLRSMQQAIYSPKNHGHFGLAYDAYCHFTSPIRRYPDLLVHRALKSLISKDSKTTYGYSKNQMEKLAEHCSMTERRADWATREAMDWLKCEFMLDKVGKTYQGMIVEVTGFGVFVELNDVYVQGLLHITSLKNDYYHYDATHKTLRGKRTGKTYRLGDPIEVLVAQVDLDERQIDFDLP